MKKELFLTFIFPVLFLVISCSLGEPLVSLPEFTILIGSDEIVNNQIYSGGDVELETTIVVECIIRNDGSEVLYLNGEQEVFLNNEEFVIQSMPSELIKPGKSSVFFFSFYAETLGTKEVVISIPNNDSDECNFSFKYRLEVSSNKVYTINKDG